MGPKLNAKETDERACNINAVGWAMLRQGFTSWCHGRAPQKATSGQSPEARTHGGLELKQRGEMVNTHKEDTRDKHRESWGTRVGSAAKADTRRTQGGHCGRMADKIWRRGQSGHKANARRIHGGHKADKVRRRSQSGFETRFGGAAKADTRRTQPDTWRTHGGKARGARSEHIAANHFC